MGGGRRATGHETPSGGGAAVRRLHDSAERRWSQPSDGWRTVGPPHGMRRRISAGAPRMRVSSPGRCEIRRLATLLPVTPTANPQSKDFESRHCEDSPPTEGDTSMRTFDVQGIGFDVPSTHAFAFIADPDRLPEWTQAFASVHGARALLRTPN